MNHDKRLTVLVLTLMLALSLCACGKGKEEDLFSEKNYQNHTTIETVALSDTVAMICEGAFEGCTSLKTVELTTKVWLLEQNAFSGCTSLETIRYTGTMAQFEEIRREDHWAPVGQTVTIVCSDGFLTVDDSGNVVPAAEETKGAENTDLGSADPGRVFMI